jgi:shikimate kinase
MRNTPKNIVVIGFMGSGKTEVSKVLGKKLGRKVIEVDDLIIGKSKRKTINDIFEKDGETVFREFEIEAAKDIKDEKGVIISTGGGAVMNKIIMDYYRENGEVVYLETSFHECAKRLEPFNDRPLFKNLLGARKLFEFRRPLYDYYSDYMVNTNGKTIKQIADEIIRKIR